MLPRANLLAIQNITPVKGVIDWLTAAGIEIRKIDLVRQKPVVEIVNDDSNSLRDHEKAICYGRENGFNRIQLMVGCVRVEWLQ